MAAVAVLLAGCAGPAEQGHFCLGRSIVFDAPPLRHRYHQRAAGDPQFAAGVPWYLDRNDYYPSVDAGYRGSRSDWTVNRTYDRQAHSGGRIRDHYRSRTTTRRSFHTED